MHHFYLPTTFELDYGQFGIQINKDKIILEGNKDERKYKFKN